MKPIIRLRYLTALVLLGACLLIGITLKFADAIDNLAEPEKCEVHYPDIPQYSAVWRGIYNPENQD